MPPVVPAGDLPWAMIVLAIIFAGGWFVSLAIAAHLPRLLEALGATPAAVATSALVGPAQVAARLVEFSIFRRASPLVSARLATGLIPLVRRCWRSSALRRQFFSCYSMVAATGC